MEKGSRVVLTILFAGLAVALAKGGWTGTGGAKDWFKSKFLGLPPGTASPADWSVPATGDSSAPAGSTAAAPPAAPAAPAPKVSAPALPPTRPAPATTPKPGTAAWNAWFNQEFNAGYSAAIAGKSGGLSPNSAWTTGFLAALAGHPRAKPAASAGLAGSAGWGF